MSSSVRYDTRVISSAETPFLVPSVTTSTKITLTLTLDGFAELTYSQIRELKRKFDVNK